MSKKFSFADLKKRSENSVAVLQKKLEETSRKGFQKDERYWRPTRDDNGNALALIRFLPAPACDEGEIPYATYYDHYFDVNKRYYRERSLSTFGEPDPVGEANSALWDTGDESKRDIARSRKRNLHYIANIYVIKDANAPENNNKNFLYDFGPKIFGKIKDLAQPEFDDDEPIDVFNIFSGANFRLKVKKQGDFPNYDDSTFEAPSPLAGGDEEKMEEIWNGAYSLEAEVSRDKFKSYDELKKKFEWVLNGNNAGKTAEEKIKEQFSSSDDDEDFNLLDKELSKKSNPVVEDDEDELDLSDFNLDSDDDDIPF